MCRFETTGVQLAQSSVCPSRSCQTKLRKIKIRKKRVAPPPRGPTRLGGAAAEMRGDPVASYCRRRRDARAEIVLPLPSVKRPRCNFRAASVQNVRATCTGSAGTLIFRSASVSRKVSARENNASPMRTRTRATTRCTTKPCHPQIPDLPNRQHFSRKQGKHQSPYSRYSNPQTLATFKYNCKSLLLAAFSSHSPPSAIGHQRRSQRAVCTACIASPQARQREPPPTHAPGPGTTARLRFCEKILSSQCRAA